MSRGFMSALAGIGMTLFSWYGPWAWPAWPAFATLHLIFGSGQSWIELAEPQRAWILVVIIAINVAFWGALAFGAMAAISRASVVRRDA
jgi:hypothetical protein